MALFVALVVIMILYVLVYQLWHSASVESRIAKNQSGYMKCAQALRSAVAYCVALIQEDLTQDVEEGSGTTSAAGSSTAVSPLSEPLTSGSAARDASRGSAASGVGKVGSAQSAQAIGGRYDYQNESLFQVRKQAVNDISVKMEIRDGESMINLNRLYEYVAIWQQEKAEIDKVSEKDEEEKAEAARGSDKKDKEATEARDKLKEILGPESQAPDEDSEKKWVVPDEAQRDAARRLLADLIIYMVEANIENGFDWKELYTADEVARAIEEYVFNRKAGDEQGFIFTIAELLQVPGVTHELYHGPLPPELVDPDLALVPGEEGYRLDEFGDVTYDYGLWGEDAGYLDSPVGPAAIGDLRELDSLRDLDLPANLGRLGEYGRDLGQRGGYMPGMASLAGTPFADNEDGTGIVRNPEPLGLKHLLTTFSNGKINLNTAHVELIKALLQGGGDQGAWNEEDKLEVGRAIAEWRNQYTEEYLKELEEEELNPGLRDEYETALSSYTGIDDIRTNYFRSIADLEKVGDGELLKASGVDSGRTERSIGWLARKDLSPVAVFNSEFFTVRIVALGESFRQEAEFVVHRDTKKKLVSVVYYRERQD